MAYHFTLTDPSREKIELPIPPGELKMSKSGKNTVINLINGGDYNILKYPGLEEISFDFLLPQSRYPAAGNFQPVKTYTDFIERCMRERKPIDFTIIRETPNGRNLFDTNVKMAIEDFSTTESWEEGFDVKCSIKLKQYKPYGTKKYSIEEKTTTPPTDPNKNDRVEKDSPNNYTVKKGDTLSLIAKKVYGVGKQNNWKKIYEANKSLINKTAQKYGKKDSSNGHWIYPGTVLIIPKLK